MTLNTNKKLKVLYLYAETMGYTMATVRELAQLGAEVHVVHWERKKLTPFRCPCLANVSFYCRSDFGSKELGELCAKVLPDIVVVCGWQDPGYLWILPRMRRRGVPVVVGFDDQWHGSLRQCAALSVRCALKVFFSHAWVSGPCQYEYARRLGFKKREVIFDLYSADLRMFNEAYENHKRSKTVNYPHRFLFVGRLERVKGIDVLMGAWEALGEKRRDWDMLVIGHGSCERLVRGHARVTVREFMQPDALADVVAGAGCLVLPSRDEPWGVVVHEFAAAGLPLLCSEVCGASASFLIHGWNGYIFKANDVNSLADAMASVINLDDAQLSAISSVSHHLGQRITPNSSARNLLSLVDRGVCRPSHRATTKQEEEKNHPAVNTAKHDYDCRN